MVFLLGKFDGILGLDFDEIVVGNATLVCYVSLKIIIIFFLQFLFQGLRGLYVGFYPTVLGSAVSWSLYFFIVSVNLRSLCIQLYVFLNLQTSARFPLYAKCIPALEFSVNPWIIFSSMFLFSLRVFFLCFGFVLREAVN